MIPPAWTIVALGFALLSVTSAHAAERHDRAGPEREVITTPSGTTLTILRGRPRSRDGAPGAAAMESREAAGDMALVAGRRLWQVDAQTGRVIRACWLRGQPQRIFCQDGD